jgi:hypothetical protein
MRTPNVLDQLRRDAQDLLAAIGEVEAQVGRQ